MRKLKIHEAKTHLSLRLAELAPNEVIILCRNNEPVAEIRALPKRLARRRPWGTDSGVLAVPENINDPFPDAELSDWEG